MWRSFRTRGREAKYAWVRFRNRLSSASKIRFALDLVNILASLWVLYVPSRVALARIKNTPYEVNLLWFGAASLYLLVHKSFLRDIGLSAPAVEQDKFRKRTIANAINSLAGCMYHGTYNAQDLSTIEQCILCAILSHVQTTVDDVTGIYVNVNLIVPDPEQEGQLMVLNRAKLDRPLYARYSAAQLLAGKAMEGLHDYLYEPSIEIPNKPYRSILVMPIVENVTTGANNAIGAVSIDSGKEDHFGPYIDKLVLSLLPHLANLRMALLLRRRRNVWK